jgi:hypothetical protein
VVPYFLGNGDDALNGETAFAKVRRRLELAPFMNSEKPEQLPELIWLVSAVVMVYGGKEPVTSTKLNRADAHPGLLAL